MIGNVSVLTLNRGRNDHLLRLLEGLSRGNPPGDCVIVQMGAEELSVRPTEFAVKEIRMCRRGLPLAEARNAGRRAASGSVLIFLDVDCIPSADLVTVLSAHAANSDGLVCCAVTYLPNDAIFDGWTEAVLQRAGKQHPARQFPTTGLEAAPHPGLFWSLAFAVRTATFDRIGGFDEGYLGYGAEDTDFACRAAALGIPILFSAQGQAFHQRHAACDPPLQHFGDIMRNACRFRGIHGFWPMQGWIDAFVRLGLVTGSATEGYVPLREPTAVEIASARLPADRPF